MKILPLNFTKRYKVAEKTPHVQKQGAKIATFCKDKRSKELISPKIEVQMIIFT